MRVLITALIYIVLSLITAVHAKGPDEDAGKAKTSHSKIETDQLGLEVDFSKEDIDCYKKFSVNNCLDSVDTRRRGAIANLNQQKNLLNDAERKARGAEQIRKIEAKSQLEKPQLDIDQRVKSSQEYRNLSKHPNETDQRPRTPAATEASARDASEERLLANRKKTQARIDLDRGTFEKTKKFKERQDASVTRRVQHEAEQAKRNKSWPKPLPLPE